ncbi:hypothetical protein, partial [Enterococcus sp. 5B7_DIV0075]|uniref:hypothetical protein n=1 Tax=Enterococcus sp. 5B7_DIV0075 TaxID=1987386 RepID=UPI001C4F5162
KSKEQLRKIAFHIFVQLRVISRSCLVNTENKIVAPSVQLRKSKEQLRKIVFLIFEQTQIILEVA